MTFFDSENAPASAESSLSVHRYLIRLGGATGNAFLWVFIFQYFAISAGTIAHALVETLLLYALCQTTTLLLTPFAVSVMRRGMRRGIIYGTLLLAAGFVYAGALIGGFFPQGTVVIGIFLGAYRAFYRVPYVVERATVPAARRITLLPEIFLALVPVAAGIVLVQNLPGPTTAPALLLFISGALALFALLPLFNVPNVYERFPWKYRETFMHLFAPEHRTILTSAVASGMGGMLLFFILPLAAFFAFDRSYLLIGLLFSMVLFVILITRSNVRRVMVEQYTDFGSYIDEYTALKEMGLACGRLALALALAVTLAVFF